MPRPRTGCTGTLVARADSAFYSAAFTGAERQAGACFSVTTPMNPAVKAAIAGIPEAAWTPVKYPRAIWDDQLRCCRPRRRPLLSDDALKLGIMPSAATSSSPRCSYSSRPSNWADRPEDVRPC
jgi:hypothetical protein